MLSVPRSGTLQFSIIWPKDVKIWVLDAFRATKWNVEIFKHLTQRYENLRFRCIPCHKVKLGYFQSFDPNMWKFPCHAVKLCHFLVFDSEMWKIAFWMHSVPRNETLPISIIWPEDVKNCVLDAFRAMKWNFAIFKYFGDVKNWVLDVFRVMKWNFTIFNHLTRRYENLSCACIPMPRSETLKFSSIWPKNLRFGCIPCHLVKLGYS